MKNFEILNYINLTVLALISIRIFWKEKEKTIVLIILASIFSLLSSFQYLLFNAPDVAITEASIGACLSTIFILKASPLISTNSKHLINKPLEPNLRHDSAIFCIFLGIFALFFYKHSIHFQKLLSPELSYLNNQTIEYYINQTINFLQFPNIVTAIIVSFRGYDTLIETIVILTSGASILAILPPNEKPIVVKKSPLCDKVLLTNMLMMIIPFIVLFAFYVQLHGEESPGGGFQSGSILASAVIAYGLAISETAIFKYLKNSLLLKIGALGALIYFSVGIIPLLKNQNFLNHSYFLCDSFSNNLLCFAKSQKIGIFLSELGVGMTVFAVMTIIFFNLQLGNKDD